MYVTTSLPYAHNYLSKWGSGAFNLGVSENTMEFLEILASICHQQGFSKWGRETPNGSKMMSKILPGTMKSWRCKLMKTTVLNMCSS